MASSIASLVLVISSSATEEVLVVGGGCSAVRYDDTIRTPVYNRILVVDSEIEETSGSVALVRVVGIIGCAITPVGGSQVVKLTVIHCGCCVLLMLGAQDMTGDRFESSIVCCAS